MSDSDSEADSDSDFGKSGVKILDSDPDSAENRN
jgi:hypothetical protein